MVNTLQKIHSSTFTNSRYVPSSSHLSPSSSSVPPKTHNFQHCHENSIQAIAFMLTYVEDHNVINMLHRYGQAWMFEKKIIEKILQNFPKIYNF